MKKVIIVGFLILVVGIGIYFLNNKKTNSVIVSTQNNNVVGNTVAEVAKHSTAADCWMIIDNNIYDLTKYQNAHPGGKMNIINYCGKDATVEYKNRGGKGTHSAKADKLLKEYLVGIVNQ
jgi:cytochrome b involved in lipid metabolism